MSTQHESSEVAGRSYPLEMTVEEMEAAMIALERHRHWRHNLRPGSESIASRWRAADALELRLAALAQRAGSLDPREVETDG